MDCPSRHDVSASRDLAVPPARVWRALLDLEHYALWWPADLSPRVVQLMDGSVGSKLEMRAGEEVFSFEITGIVADERIDLSLRSGVYEGRAEWTVESDEAKTSVSLRVIADAHPRILKGPALTAADAQSGFRRMMRKVFERLEYHLTHL